MHRFFGEEPVADWAARIGQTVGNVVGVGILLMMLWVVTRGFT